MLTLLALLALLDVDVILMQRSLSAGLVLPLWGVGWVHAPPRGALYDCGRLGKPCRRRELAIKVDGFHAHDVARIAVRICPAIRC